MKTNNNISNINGGCYSSDTLLRYIKGELSGLEMNQVERHLGTCEMCCDELEGLSLLKDPDEINSIRIVLNSRVDRVVEEEKEGISAWGLYFRIAASIILLIGASTLIYISVFKNSPSILMSKTEAFDIAMPEALMESSPPYEEKEIASNAPKENPKMAYSGTAGKSAKINDLDEEKMKEVVKYVAPVIVDSIKDINNSSDKIVEMEVTANDQLVTADSEMMSKREVFASGQAVANAPVKTESVERRDLFNHNGLTRKDNVSVDTNDRVNINYSSMKDSAIKLYSSGKYFSTIAILNKLNVDYQKIDTIQFYTSMSYYHLSLNEKSISGLKLLSQNPKSAYFSDAQWYYALNLLRNGWTEQADSVLLSIVNVNPKYKEEAIKKLEWLKR